MRVLAVKRSLACRLLRLSVSALLLAPCLVAHADKIYLQLVAMREAGVDGPRLAREIATGLLPSGFRLADA